MMSLVSVESLSKSYREIRAVDDFSFAVDQGEIYALVGPDGAGKTTIIRTLCGLINPDSGVAMIDGLDCQRKFESIKPILGYMPQVFSLYPDLTVTENLTFYGGIYGVVGEDYRTRVEYLYRFSNLKPFADRRAQALSGGMKQKLALSCALMHQPRILILDEPTTGVDPLSRRQFWEILLELKKQGVTIIVSTPYMDEVARSDRACFVFKGKKLAEGTPAALPGLFEGSLYFCDCRPTVQTLEALNQVSNVQARRFGGGIHVYLRKDVTLPDIATELTRAGFDTGGFRPIRPDLEDCFIQLMEES
ncbi:MAG: ABC transporter ATP-binding protein [Candidatus Zixiibacteriota bacterium]|nr:MAG: ABC transporter ATP-binding protein [candidate division Zixibacteria bacterium]